MHFPTLALLAGAALLNGVGCAADHAATDHARSPRSFLTSHTYRDRTGLVTETDLYDRMPRVLARHGFFIVEHEIHGQTLNFTTQWRGRAPFDEEEMSGAVRARTRLELRAVRSGRMYSVNLEAENMIEMASSPEWVRTILYDETLAYLEEIATDLRMELATGIRRF